jgi:hypothetical protein
VKSRRGLRSLVIPILIAATAAVGTVAGATTLLRGEQPLRGVDRFRRSDDNANYGQNSADRLTMSTVNDTWRARFDVPPTGQNAGTSRAQVLDAISKSRDHEGEVLGSTSATVRFALLTQKSEDPRAAFSSKPIWLVIFNGVPDEAVAKKRGGPDPGRVYHVTFALDAVSLAEIFTAIDAD